MKRLLVPATVLASMKKIAFTLLCGTLLTLVAAPAWAQCPSLGNATGCGVLITVDSSGTALVTNPINGNPYDLADDTLVGISNNSGGSFQSITLSASLPIFGFDGDGVCGFGNTGTTFCFNGAPTGSYQGPNNTFSNISSDFKTGTINFITPLANGQSTWFALEGVPTSVTVGAISQTQTLTFTCPGGTYPCNNVQKQATANCGSTEGTGPCPNPDASSIKLGFDTVIQQFQLQITFTEVDGDGVCVIPASGNANDSTDFDCTWANFFGDSKPSYGSGPPFTGPFTFAPGTTVHVPYCLHYARNFTKCVDIDAELLNGAGPGTHFSGSILLYVAWNALTSSLFPPVGGPWGSDPTVTPRFYDAPHNDLDTVDYPFPIPTGYPYSPSDQQKVFDITGYFNLTGQAGVDSGIGCKPPQTCPKNTNHYAVAFPLAASTPDQAELLFPFANPDPACYVKGLPMPAAFELETAGTEIFDPNALTAPNYARIAVLQGTVPVNAPLLVPVTLFNPPPPFGFLAAYFAVLSNASLKTSTSTSQTLYQLQVFSDLIPKPLTKNFVVKKSCSFR